jgi:hypothetical protein
MSTRFVSFAKLASSVAAFVAVLAPASISVASFYPPDYVIETKCQTDGAVEVCATNHKWGNYPRLTVRYRDGYLQASQWGRLSAYVKLNGREGTFRMTNANYVDSVTLNDPVSYLCYAKDPSNPNQTIPEGPYRLCERTEQTGGPLVWEVTPPPQAEADLFFYARTPQGIANAWDVEVAIRSDDGRWDSRFGQNYRFRFEP